MLVIAIAVVSVAKLIVAVIWPAYIAAGWLRIVAQARRRPSARKCCEPLVQGMKAGYQVVWASSMLTNICISNRSLWAKWKLIEQTIQEGFEFAKGDRADLSPVLQSLSLFPPVLVGLFHDSWDLYLRTLARRLRVSPDIVQEAWRGLARQMIWFCQAAVEEDLITDEWVQEVPGGLCSGLPARCFLQAVERSPHRKLVLVGGLTITEDRVAELGGFAKTVWKRFCEVQDARNAAAGVLNPDVHHLLCAKLLAGGEDPSTLPPNLADAIQKYENLPDATKVACQSVLNPLMAFGLACGKEKHFKEKLKLVIESLPHLDSESILQLHFGAPIAHEDRDRRSETRYVFAAPMVDLEAQYVFAAPRADLVVWSRYIMVYPGSFCPWMFWSAQLRSHCQKSKALWRIRKQTRCDSWAQLGPQSRQGEKQGENPCRVPPGGPKLQILWMEEVLLYQACGLAVLPRKKSHPWFEWLFKFWKISGFLCVCVPTFYPTI